MLPRNPPAAVRRGDVLFGDDLSDEELELWFAQEKEAFFQRDGGRGSVDPWYTYMRLVNERLGFSQVSFPDELARSVLVLGPGSGAEIERFAARNQHWQIYFVEASDNLKKELRRRFPASTLVDVRSSGDLNVPEGSQDVVCAFSVLHHVPNVSHVVCEIARSLRPGGLFLVREPCSSMGVWGSWRAATPNERGISSRLLTKMASAVGLELVNAPTPVLYEPLNIIIKRLGVGWLLPTPLFYWLDKWVSLLASFYDHYWRDAWHKKLGPSAYFYVFRKSSAASNANGAPPANSVGN